MSLNRLCKTWSKARVSIHTLEIVSKFLMNGSKTKAHQNLIFVHAKIEYPHCLTIDFSLLTSPAIPQKIQLFRFKALDMVIIQALFFAQSPSRSFQNTSFPTRLKSHCRSGAVARQVTGKISDAPSLQMTYGFIMKEPQLSSHNEWTSQFSWLLFLESKWPFTTGESICLFKLKILVSYSLELTTKTILLLFIQALRTTSMEKTQMLSSVSFPNAPIKWPPLPHSGTHVGTGIVMLTKPDKYPHYLGENFVEKS